MAQSGLKLVPRRDRNAGGPVGRAPTIALSIVVVLAWSATLPHDVPASRRLPDALEQATAAVKLSMERGATDREAIRVASQLRDRVRIAPLDSRTRSIYSAVLLALSRTLEQTRAAAFHAQLAAELSPVTTSIVRRSTRVLFGAGDFDSARVWNRRLFEFDPQEGARMLLTLEPGLTDQDLIDALPDEDAAWLAWSRELQLAGREAEADRWIDRAFDRWPDSIATLQAAGARAMRDKDWERLSTIFAAAPEFADEIRSAVPLAYRAQLAAHLGQDDQALADVDRAVRLGPKNPTVWTYAGDVYLNLDRVDEARSSWNRALYETGPEETQRRANVLARLGRLERNHGQASQAIRHWEEVLRLRPDDAEAIRNVQSLRGR